MVELNAPGGKQVPQGTSMTAYQMYQSPGSDQGIAFESGNLYILDNSTQFSVIPMVNDIINLLPTPIYNQLNSSDRKSVV